MSKTAARIALVCALVGLAASVAAAYVHYNLLRNPSYTSFCDVNATLNCSQVYSSAYGAVGGISVAVFGAIFFAGATLLSVAWQTAGPEVRESAPGYLFAGSTIALAVVLYLGYASFVLLHLVCVLCLTTYAAVIGLFLVSGGGATIPMTALPRRAARDLRTLFSSATAMGLTFVLAAGAIASLVLFPRAGALGPEAAAADPVDRAAQFEEWYTAQPRLTLSIPNEGEKVLVVKFNDYQCPPCRQTHMQYKSIFEKYAESNPGEVRVVLRDFPLEKECNVTVTSDFHASGCDAAVAVRLAKEHGRAEALQEWIFSNQPALTPELVRQGARDIGQVNDMEARYSDTLELVKADTQLGRQLGVQSTPTFFLNGVKIEGGLPIEYFDQAIAYELQRASSQ